MVGQKFITSEEKSQKLLTLVIDKKGIFGEVLCHELHGGGTTVFVTEGQGNTQDDIVRIPFIKQIPEIPDGMYTHMFFVWDGKKESLPILEPLLQKAAADSTQFVFVTDYHFYTEKLARFIHQEYSKATIVFTGDVFGNEQYQSIITLLFQEAHEHSTMHLESVGLLPVYPVSFSDTVTHVLHVGFGGRKKPICFAFAEHGMTELSVAHALQKVDPLITIDFLPDERKSLVLPEGEYLVSTTNHIIEEIQSAFTDYRVGKKGKSFDGSHIPSFSPLATEKQQRKKTKRSKKWLVIVVALLILVFSPVLLTLLYAGLGGSSLYAALGSAKKGDFASATSFAKASATLFAFAEGTNTVAATELQTLLLYGAARTLTTTVAQGSLFATLGSNIFSGAESFAQINQNKSLTPSADFLAGIENLKQALITISQAPAGIQIDGVSLSQIAASIEPFESVLDVSPTLFGFPTKKTYMVLFQNNTELRPGGGFIGSYALVSVDKGRITDFSIHDVYDADGQLKGHVEPPFIIRRYIQVHWYLRDSNFDVDFSRDAANAAFFLQQESGQKVDGVIGVDLTFVKDILAAVGPVYVAQYNQTVTADNFFLLTETHAEKQTFAGSQQKKDFLTALFSSLQQKIATKPAISAKGLLPVLMAPKQKDIVFGFSDALMQDVFTVNGLSSSPWDGRKAAANTVQDMTGINEANIGINKANYFVTRQISQSMQIAKTGSVSGQLSITYKNTSNTGQWPGGVYRNYLRLILSTGATIGSITINGIPQHIVSAVTDPTVYEAKGFIAPKGLEVDSAAEGGKQLFGFIVAVPEQSSQTIDITYALSGKIDITQPTFTYSGWLFKQPGVEDTTYTFSLTAPSNFSVLQKPEWVVGSSNTISFTKSFTEDIPFIVVFTQK